MLFRRTRHQLEAVPYVGADPARERRWRPAADGRLFDLRTNGERLPAGWVALELEIAGGVTAAPRLLVDDGRGFADAAALQLPPIKGGRVRSIVELPPRVRQLVLEVGNNASRISLGSLLASELGAAETAVRLMLPVILRRFAEPWTIPISAVRLVRALFTGGFLWRMVEKQRGYDEPQLWYEGSDPRLAELSQGDRAGRPPAGAPLLEPAHPCGLLWAP